MNKNWHVPLSKNSSHPIVVSIGHNLAMGAFDIGVDVGNFKTRADAENAAKRIKEALEDLVDAKFAPRVS